MGSEFDDKRRTRLHGIDALSNPFAPRNWLDDLVKPSAPGPTSLADLLNVLSPPSPSSGISGFGSPFSLAPPATPRLPVDTNSLGGLFGLAPPSPSLGLFSPTPRPPALPVQPKPAPAAAPTKRKGFFSFHFDDLLRVNNVRNAWNISHPDRPMMRNFYDRSLWESTKLRNTEGLKNLIRRGMVHSSTVCVLVGTHTWERRWVKYEIARSVVESKGLLAIHINGLKHHKRLQPDPLGFNPLHLMGIFKASDGKYYIYDKRAVVVNNLTGQTEFQWLPYNDYTLAVRLPKYLQEPPVGYVMPLSQGAIEYDYIQEVGHKNLGSWIDTAAIRAGR